VRELTHPTRRRFGKGLGGALTLAVLPRAARTHEGTHEIAVRIARFTFDPDRIEIFVGDSVTWSNADLAPHTATAEDGAWDTGALDRGGAGRITFGTVGEHRYFCAFHPHMRGAVVVRAKADG
jgi:plastocyanin